MNSESISFWQQTFEKLIHNAKAQEWAAFGGCLLLGLLVIWILDNKVTIYLQRWLSQWGEELAQKIAAVFKAPLRVLIFGYFFMTGFDFVKTIPSVIWQRVHGFYPVFNSVVVLLFAFKVVDIIAAVLKRRWALDQSSLDERWANLFGYLGKALVLLLGGLMLMQNMGINIIPLLTGAGFLGAAIALALQSTIANAIGSLEIMMDRLFKEGDRIAFGEYDGFVTKMGLRSIELTSLTGEKITLPNKDFVDKQIRNYSKTDNKNLKGCTRIFIPLGITYDHNRTQIEHAMHLLRDCLQKNSRVKETSVTFVKFGNSTLDLSAGIWADYKNEDEYNDLVSALMLAIKETFDANKITFAFPTQTLYLKNQFSESK